MLQNGWPRGLAFLHLRPLLGGILMVRIKCPWCSRILDLGKYQVTKARYRSKHAEGYCPTCSRYMAISWTDPEPTPISYKDKI